LTFLCDSSARAKSRASLSRDTEAKALAKRGAYNQYRERAIAKCEELGLGKLSTDVGVTFTLRFGLV
jgi:hypothetical protein